MPTKDTFRFRLSEHYHVETDRWNWILVETSFYERRDKSQGSRQHKTFHQSLQSLCKYVVNEASKECSSFDQAVEIYNAVAAHLRSVADYSGAREDSWCLFTPPDIPELR